MTAATTAWKGRRVLVTGGTGFIGAAAVRELLARGAEVVGLVRDRAADAEFARHRLAGKVHVVHGRTEDLFRLHSALAVHEVRLVLHLAAGGTPDRGTATVLDAARRYDSRVPVVLARPTSAGGDDLPAGQPVGLVRFGEVFGGGDRKTFRTVPATVVSLVTGERPAIPADGPPRDCVYVRDAAAACLATAESLLARPGPRVEEHTFRSGWNLTDRELTAAVRDVFAGRGVLNPPPPPNPLGWAPAAGLADALGETVAWYRDFLRTRFFGTRPADGPTRAAA